MSFSLLCDLPTDCLFEIFRYLLFDDITVFIYVSHYFRPLILPRCTEIPPLDKFPPDYLSFNKGNRYQIYYALDANNDEWRKQILDHCRRKCFLGESFTIWHVVDREDIGDVLYTVKKLKTIITDIWPQFMENKEEGVVIPREEQSLLSELASIYNKLSRDDTFLYLCLQFLLKSGAELSTREKVDLCLALASNNLRFGDIALEIAMTFRYTRKEVDWIEENYWIYERTSLQLELDDETNSYFCAALVKPKRNFLSGEDI